MLRALRRGMLIAGLVVGSPLAASADEVTREAKTRFDEGLAYLKSGDFEGARVSFAQAYAIAHRASILWNLALAEEKSGHTLEALGHFKEYVRQFPSEGEAAAAQRHLDALLAQTGHIEVVAPVGARVMVDGATAGIAPLGAALDVAPGKHRLEVASSAGAKTLEAEVAAGQVAHVSLLAGGAVSGLLPPGGAPAGRPLATGDAPVDAHTPVFWTPRTVALAAIGGAALVSLGFGVGFGLQAQSEGATASRYAAHLMSGSCASPVADPQCSRWSDAADAHNRDQTLSNIFYVGAGALAGGAVAAWLLWPQEPGPVAWVTPALGQREVGLSAAGRF